MKVPWPGDQCIICLKRHVLSEEHVIPESLGGILNSDFLCKPCNDQFGSGLESKAKTDPAIRLAVSHLQSQIPDVYLRVENGQQYVARSGPARVRATFRDGELTPRTSRHEDGSLFVPTADAPAHIERILKRDGHDTEFISRALAKVRRAPEGQKIELSKTLSLINWPTENPKLDLGCAPRLDDLVSVKIAFEFLALMSGTAICHTSLQLDEVRRVLRCAHKSKAVDVEPLLAPDYSPFHGICFEGNDPHVKIQVRLFGKLAYRVHFRQLALNVPKVVYTHDLKSGDESVCQY